MTTAENAHDELCALVLDAITDAASEVGLGYIPEIRWPYVAEPSKPDVTKVWCRVVTAIVSERQASLSCEVGEAGTRMFTSVGSLVIEIYAPRSIRDFGAWYMKFCRVIRNKFRKERSANIWYRNTTINDSIMPEAQFYRLNVITEYTFNEVA